MTADRMRSVAGQGYDFYCTRQCCMWVPKNLSIRLQRFRNLTLQSLLVQKANTNTKTVVWHSFIVFMERVIKWNIFVRASEREGIYQYIFIHFSSRRDTTNIPDLIFLSCICFVMCLTKFIKIWHLELKQRLESTATSIYSLTSWKLWYTDY